MISNDYKVLKLLYHTIQEKKLCFNSVLLLTSRYSHTEGTGIFNDKIVNIGCYDLGFYNDMLFCEKYGIDYNLVPTYRDIMILGVFCWRKQYPFRQWLDDTIKRVVIEDRKNLKIFCNRQ